MSAGARPGSPTRSARRARAAARLFAALLAASALGASASGTPAFDEVREHARGSEAWLLDRHGEPLQRQRLDFRVRQLPWVQLGDISPAFRASLLDSEDRRFYAHSGVDAFAIAAAIWQNLWREHTRGASTLTMQLAALLDPALAPGDGRRSLARKLVQMRAAWALESRWTKDEILEAYVNLVPFRGEVVGVAALAQAYFGKHPAGLDQRESALAAALLRAPNAPPARVAHRACALLRGQHAGANCRELPRLAAQALARPRPLQPEAADAPHLARQLLASPGERIRSTLDAQVQRFARRVLREQVSALAGRNVEDGAVVVVDNASGDVLAWVGGSGEHSGARDVDAALAPRQAGSTLKPFLYALAIEGWWLTAASILDDSPLRITTPGGLYVPQNYDRSFRGRVSLRTALGSSLNVPAVRTLALVSPDAFHRRLRDLGFDSLQESGDYYGYSLALGSAEVSLAMLTNAYRTLANGGRHSPLRFRAAPPSEQAFRQVLDPGAAHVVTDILADRNARVSTFGLGSILDTRQWSAVKTGTSKDLRDNWCVGFDDRYTVGVWVGNLSGAPMWDVAGTSGAAPVWHAIMAELQANRKVRPPATPAGLVRVAIEFDDGLEPAREELFVAGTEQRRIQPVDHRTAFAPRIVYPGNGAVLTYDPDIPAANHGVVFAASAPPGAALAWRLDGKPYAPADATVKWLPAPGRHRLALVDVRGRTLDAVTFEVRGASDAARRPTRRCAKPPGLPCEARVGGA